MNSPARLETALDVVELLEAGGSVLVATPTAPRTEHTGGGGGGGGLSLLPLLAGGGGGGALHLLLLHVQVDGVLVVLVGLLRLGGLLLEGVAHLLQRLLNVPGFLSEIFHIRGSLLIENIINNFQSRVFSFQTL